MGIMEKAILSEIKAIKDKMETKVDSKDLLELEVRVKKLENTAFAKNTLGINNLLYLTNIKLIP